jgi:GTP-binding protein
MIIHSATFVKSSENLSQCPKPSLPEFAFIGRSNVGKSSLINMLAENQKLAKISSQPGKTRTINHFIINDRWYLVDLPGYGYAKVSAGKREKWIKDVKNYLVKRANLGCLFVLIDSRIKPQEIDLEFLEMAGLSSIPIARVFTKTDKLSANEIQKIIKDYDKVMLEKWEELPVTFITSAIKKTGRMDILDFIEQSINNWKISR